MARQLDGGAVPPSVAASSNGDGPTGAKAGTVATVHWTKRQNLASSNHPGSARPGWWPGSAMREVVVMRQ